MRDGDELHEIKQCGADWQGHRCVLPEGHYEEHQSMILLPPDVGKMLDVHLTVLEREAARTAKARRWFWIGCAFYFATAIWNLAQIFT
jgi:hypothetical protein